MRYMSGEEVQVGDRVEVSWHPLHHNKHAPYLATVTRVSVGLAYLHYDDESANSWASGYHPDGRGIRSTVEYLTLAGSTAGLFGEPWHDPDRTAGAHK